MTNRKSNFKINSELEKAILKEKAKGTRGKCQNACPMQFLFISSGSSTVPRAPRADVMPIDLKKYNLLEGLEDDVEFIFEGLKIAILEDIVIIMKNKRISRAELARRLNTSRAYITRMLRANVNFTVMSLIRIARALGAELTVNFLPKTKKVQKRRAKSMRTRKAK